MAEDLYAILGLSKGASEQEIKKAYRQQARKYHPDVNKEAGAEDKFKKIQKSYAILSDSQKKAQYDRFGVADDSPGGGGGAGGFGGFGTGAGFGGFSSSFEGSIDDVFDAFFGGGRSGQSQSTGMQGEDLRYDLEISLEEAATGFNNDITIFHLETKPGSQKKSSECDGFGQIHIVQRTMLGNFSQVATCPHCQGKGCIEREKRKKTLNVKVPAGVETGVKLKMANEGNGGFDNGPNGDLYIYITVKEHSQFRREGSDIYLDVNIGYTEAILGTNIDVPTLEGTAQLKVPSGTESHSLFKLKGKGLPSLRGYGKGSQFVRVHVVFPKKLSGKEKKLIQELNELEETSNQSPKNRVRQR